MRPSCIQDGHGCPATGRGVAVDGAEVTDGATVGVALGCGVEVNVGEGVGVTVDVEVDVSVGCGVDVADDVTVGASVAVLVGSSVDVADAVTVGAEVAVFVGAGRVGDGGALIAATQSRTNADKSASSTIPLSS